MRKLTIIMFSVLILNSLFSLRVNADEWDFKITAVMSSSMDDMVVKTDLIAGIRTTGTDDFDNLWDTKIFENDMALSEVNLTAYWSHPEYEQEKTKLLRDIRQNVPSEWNMVISSNMEKEITLYWTLPKRGGCNVPKLELVDSKNNITVNMDEVNHYTFLNGKNENSFIVKASTDKVLAPPSSPVNLWIPMSSSDNLILVWTRNIEDDIAGYNIYRRESNKENYKRVNPGLKNANKFLDAYLESGKDYQYAVTAVGNCESGFSETVYFQH